MTDMQPNESLATLVQLARRARSTTDAAELRFILANETHALCHYQQAALWLEDRVTTLSGVVMPEANAPYTLWLSRIFRHFQKTPPTGQSCPVEAPMLPSVLAEEWQEWLPTHALWVALGEPGSRAALLLAREEPWDPAEIALLEEWAALWSMAASALRNQRPGLLTGKHPNMLLRVLKWTAGIAALASLMIPVPLVVLAPAELVPVQPAVIRAPLDGVVDRVLVQPNQPVHQGDALFEFDRAGIQNKLQVAQRTLGTLQAEYRQKAQQALLDPASKAQLAPLQGQIAEKSTEINYLRQMNDRGVAVSPRDGIALLGDPTEWIGRPVVTGEKILMVADPHMVEIEAWLTLADAIRLPEGSQVKLFLNADPLKPVTGNLRYVAHEAIERPDGSYAYRVRAVLSDPAHAPRLGLKGVARITGDIVPLGYWIIRRPLAALRGVSGL